ncbi:MAG: major facilitator transpoter, partial [Phycisphaerales bacterium]|nr:major facilitator transpoter [Phycisphaerales bacterium]
AVMTITGIINRESLRIMTLVLGAGAAMAGPAFQYVIPELVPPSELPLAIALNSVALNIARAIGPALAGIVLAVAAHWLAPVQATGLSFVINAVAFVGVIWVLVRWKRAPQKQLVHRETLGGAAMTAFRYTAHSPALRAILIRVAAFILCAVIVWAQLAIIAKQQLKGGEVVYTIMMACVGFGAVIGVFFMPKMDKRFSTDGMVSICTVAFGLALVGLSQCKGAFANVWLAGALAAVVGFNWVIVPTNFNIATQRSVPGWVKGRAIAMYMTVLFGSFAVGSPIWGKVSTAVGISNASFIAGCLVALGSLLAIPFPLTRAKGQDFGPANRPAPADAPPGPADLEMVLAYPVERARAGEFERVMHGNVRPQRLRNGATRWVLAPSEAGSESANGTVLYEEVFAFTSWSDRLRFHARTTKADAAAEEEALKFVVGPQPAPVYRPVVLGTPPLEPMVSGRRMASPPPLINWDFLATRFLEELGTMVNRMMGERPEPRDRRGRKR